MFDIRVTGNYHKDMSNKERQKRFRDERKKKGWIRIELWILPTWREEINKLVEKLKENKED